MRPAPVFGLVMVRRGMFRGRADGVDQVLDAACVYAERVGGEQQFLHPCGGDRYTEPVLAEPQVAELLGGGRATERPTLRARPTRWRGGGRRLGGCPSTPSPPR
ncbi:hypothetical protein ACFVVU_16705 [Kitasatospora sp. NPDC057965]|uniref:hypothetical protein n=1 Tax=Kitasatospora sp. NPDC057965 TaxID=3346291 RepID=UPI0036D8E720